MANSGMSNTSNTNIDFEKVCDDLEAGIVELYESKNLSKEKFIQLYSHIHNCCAIVKNNAKNNKDQPTDESKSVGLQLYKRFEEFLNNHAMELSKNLFCQNEDDLKLYVTKWEDYRWSSIAWNRICMYMNRYWIKKARTMGQIALLEIYQLAIQAWETHIFKKLNKQMCAMVLKLIESDRKNELKIDDRVIAGVINSYVEMGLNDEEGENLMVYQKNFERIFLEETERFYSQKEASILANTSPAEYMEKVDDILQEEENRIRRYLHKSTRFNLTHICSKIFIVKQLDFIVNDFVPLLENDKNQDLSRMYSLLVRITDGFSKVTPLFENHIESQGLLALEQCCKSAINNSKLYVDTILEVHNKYHELISSKFNNDQLFLMALNKACSSFVNYNAVTKIANSSTKSAELFIKYWDILLKKFKKCSELIPELKETLNQATSIYKYIEDKDALQLNYCKLFAKRLLQPEWFNYELEMVVIKKLMEPTGSIYTNKLNKLLVDVNKSKTINEEFRSGSTDSSNHGIGFNVQTFSSLAWPLEQSDNFTIFFPPELETSINLFTTFYHKKFTGRKLSWLHTASSGELQTNCFDNTYTLQVSTLQMVVLLQYTDEKSWTMEQLTECTHLESEILLQIVQGLLNAKLLTCGEDSGISSRSLISLVSKYKNDTLCVKLNRPIKFKSKFDVESSQRQIEYNRKFIIQAAIVRIMKLERTMEVSELFEKVDKVLSSKFRPNYDVIAECIDVLIDKEYLEKLKSDDNYYESYNYLP